MPYILLEIEWDGNEVKTIEVMNNEDGEIAVFDDSHEADEWLETRHQIGPTYNRVEL
jgi:hypothetical protein